MRATIFRNLKKGKICTIIASVFVLICCCFAFTACDHFPKKITFTQEELSDIVSIELINYDNPKQKKFAKWSDDHFSELQPFDENKVIAFETLDADKISQFIDTLCEFEINENYYAYDSPYGLCIKLTYFNGDFMIINNWLNSGKRGYIGKFSPSGEVAEFIGAFSTSNYFEMLITDFFSVITYIV